MKALWRFALLLGKTLVALVVAVAFARVAFAAEQKEGRVTQTVHDVRLLAAHVASRPAVVNDNVHEGMAVRTGTDSRAELTFTDQTLTRLGANTVFSLGTGVRSYDLGSGAILIHAPKELGTVRINTSVATAAITGFTTMFEFHVHSWSKFIILEGEGTLTLKNVPGGSCHLHGGQMIIIPPNPTRCPDVLNVDLNKLIKTAKLITRFPPLPSLNLILAEAKNQKTSPPSRGLVDPTGLDTIDQAAVARPHPTPPPMPHKLPGG
jgi:mannose-6-phosphate isomerase-like protein (cupin superfamily)